MHQEEQHTSLETLQEIRSIMDRSARFLTLSGWSGIWAGLTALAGAWIANTLLHDSARDFANSDAHDQVAMGAIDEALSFRLIGLAVCIFLVALVGAFLFTYRKTNRNGQKIWNSASKQMLLHGSVPLLAGGVFALGMLYYGAWSFIAPSCLIFYGLALIGGSKYTVSDIRYLGFLELLLGCICIFMPIYALWFWAFGFGILHILYGIIMWNKYDKRIAG